MKINFQGNEEFEKLYIENLKKFVYFKKDKIVGFIKFSKNILPLIVGYYFKCNYNIKINVQVAGILSNSNKELKTQIDLIFNDIKIKFYLK